LIIPTPPKREKEWEGRKKGEGENNTRIVLPLAINHCEDVGRGRSKGEGKKVGDSWKVF